MVDYNTDIDFRKFSLRQNIKFQYGAENHLFLIRETIRLTQPSWSEKFTEFYIKSRYADIWFYYERLRHNYYCLSKNDREIYRINLVLNNKLCTDVIYYITTFVE
tara:strand:+ start:2900 stop:3214 length:315 start_codon:yes stop_codon:yes gene_type:complete